MDDRPSNELKAASQTLQTEDVTPYTLMSRLKDFIAVHDFASAERTIGEVEQHNMRDVRLYSVLVGGYVGAKMMKQAEDVVARMRQQGVPPNVYTFNILIRGYIAASNLPKAIEIFERMEKSDLITYNTLLQAYSTTGDIIEANRLLERMQATGVKPDSTTLNSVLSAYATAGKIRSAPPYLLSKPDAQTADLQLYGFAKYGFVKETEELFELRLASRNPTIYTLNQVLTCYSINHDLDGMLKTIKRVRHVVRPDCLSYSMLIRLYGKLGLLQEAENVLKTMSDEELQPDIVVYYALLKCYSVRGNVKDTERIVKKIHPKDVDELIICARMEAYLNAGDPKNARAILDETKVSLSERVFHTLLRDYVKTGNVAECEKTIDEMKGRGLAAREMTSIYLMQAHSKAGDFASANRVFREILVKTTFSYTSMIGVCKRANDLVAAESLLSEMEKNNIPIRVETLHVLMQAYAITGPVTKAAECFDRFEKHGLCPTVKTFCLLIQAYVVARDMESAEKTLKDDMSNMKPNTACFNLLIFGYANGKIDLAEGVLQEMDAAGVRPNCATYATLMGGYARIPRMSRVEELFEEMQRRHLTPDVHCFNAKLLGYALMRQNSKISEVRKQMAERQLRLNHACWASILLSFDTVSEVHQVWAEALLSVKPDVMMFTTLMNKTARLGNLDDCKTVLTDMLAVGFAPCASIYARAMIAAQTAGEAQAMWETMLANVKPDLAAWNLRLESFVRLGLFEEAKHAGVEMKDSQIEPDVHSFTWLLRAEQTYEAKDLFFRSCVAASIVPSRRMFTTMIDSCKGKYELATKWMDLMESEVEADGITYAKYISASVTGTDPSEKKQLISRAERIWARMEEAKIAPSWLTINCMMYAYAQLGNVQGAEGKFQLLDQLSLRLDCSAFSTLMLAYVRSNDSRGAEKVMARIKEAGIKPTNYAYAVLMAAFSRESPEKTKQIFDEYLAEGAAPDLVMCNTLMTAYARAGDIEKTKDVWGWFSKYNILPSPHSFHILMFASAMKGDQEEVDNVLGAMKAANFPLSHITRSILESVRLGQISDEKSEGFSIDDILEDLFSEPEFDCDEAFDSAAFGAPEIDMGTDDIDSPEFGEKGPHSNAKEKRTPSGRGRSGPHDGARKAGAGQGRGPGGPRRNTSNTPMRQAGGSDRHIPDRVLGSSSSGDVRAGASRRYFDGHNNRGPAGSSSSSSSSFSCSSSSSSSSSSSNSSNSSSNSSNSSSSSSSNSSSSSSHSNPDGRYVHPYRRNQPKGQAQVRVHVPRAD